MEIGRLAVEVGGDDVEEEECEKGGDGCEGLHFDFGMR